MHRADFSRIIKKRRALLGISQVDMASMLDISYRHYQDIETGKINLRLDTIVKISDKLDIHLCIQNNRIHEGIKSGDIPDFHETGDIASELEVGFAILNSNKTYFYINDFLAQINGLSPENHVGKSIYDIVPDLAVDIEKSIDDCLSNRRIITIEVSGVIPRDLFETKYKVVFMPYNEDKMIILVKDLTLHHLSHHHFKELSTKLNLRISVPSMESPLRKFDRDAAIGNFNFLKTLLMKLYN
jgi:transcriptional regulator with XRE-family HTH domain